MFGGEEVVRLFPETQLFTDCWAPKIPPASVMSAEFGSPGVPLFSNVFPEMRCRRAGSTPSDGVGGNGSGFSMPSSPTLGLFRIVLFFTRSAYVPIRMMPLPHGIDAVVEFAGVVRLPLFSIRFFRMIVHRLMRVPRNAGVDESFEAGVAGAVLRRRLIVVVERVRTDAGRVVPEGRLLDDDVAAGVRARVAEGVVLDQRVARSSPYNRGTPPGRCRSR